MRRRVLIGTRGSLLSRRQTELVRDRLAQHHPDRAFELVAISSHGDRQPEAPLSAMAGEGIFVKELEAALQRGDIDLAVHSLKDLPLSTPPELAIGAVTAREDARDALISRERKTLAALAPGDRIGTSSPRRRSQLLCRRRDLVCEEIRGNVDTRLRKLEEGRYDAIVVAACGLVRLGMEGRITERLEFDVMLPEPGQGSLGIEIRRDDGEMRELVRAVHDDVSAGCVEAERAFLAALGGGCRVPIAAYAESSDRGLLLRGAVIALDGSKKLEDRLTGSLDDPGALGKELAERLLAQGANTVLTMIGQ